MVPVLEPFGTVAITSGKDVALVDGGAINLGTSAVTGNLSVAAGGKIDFTMRAAVGRPSRETPLLADQITDVIINPTWTVPPTVLRQDKLPKLRQTGTPGISNAAIYLDGAAVAPETVDWQSVSPSRVRIVQRPGAHNALGRYRFNLTNDQNIYLHDTNEPRVFKRDRRAVSSGCVRLAEARRLAEMLLGEEGITPAEIDRALARLEAQARERGVAVGVLSALPGAINRVSDWSKKVESRGFVLVPITAVTIKPKSS